MNYKFLISVLILNIVLANTNIHQYLNHKACKRLCRPPSRRMIPRHKLGGFPWGYYVEPDVEPEPELEPEMDHEMELEDLYDMDVDLIDFNYEKPVYQPPRWTHAGWAWQVKDEEPKRPPKIATTTTTTTTTTEEPPKMQGRRFSAEVAPEAETTTTPKPKTSRAPRYKWVTKKYPSLYG